MNNNDDDGIVANGVIVNDTKCSKPQGDSASIYQLSSCMLGVVMIILSPLWSLAIMQKKVKSIVMIMSILHSKGNVIGVWDIMIAENQECWIW